MKIKRIRFEKLKNTRDLGGFETTDGKKIRNGVLLRSGELGKASKADLEKLVNGYHLKTVIDLRTDAEVYHSPDPVPEGVSYVRCPLLDNSFLGIARDDYSIEAWLDLFRKSDKRAEEVFGDMYLKLTFDDYVKPFVKQVFELIASSDGAVLWHCSAGKDRVGVITILLLSALGVPEDVIIKDYLMTGVFTRGEILKIRFLAALKYRDAKLNRAVSCLMGVREEFVLPIFERAKRDYGSVSAMLTDHFGIDAETVEQIRSKYLV